MLAEDILDFAGQTGQNIIIHRRVVMSALLLIEQRNVYQRHERNDVVCLPTRIVRRIGVIALCDELGCSTVVLFILAVDDHVDFFVIDVQPDIEFVGVLFCHGLFSLLLFVSEDCNALIDFANELCQAFLGARKVAVGNLDHLSHF